MKPYRLIYQMDSSGVLPVSTDVDNYLELLNDDIVDAVLIALPNSLHGEVSVVVL